MMPSWESKEENNNDLHFIFENLAGPWLFMSTIEDFWGGHSKKKDILREKVEKTLSN